MNELCRSRRVSKTRHDWFSRVFAPAQAKDLRLPKNEEHPPLAYNGDFFARPRSTLVQRAMAQMTSVPTAVITNSVRPMLR